MSRDEVANLVAEVCEAFLGREEQRILLLFTDDAEWIAPQGNATAVALDCPHHMIGARAIAQFAAQQVQQLLADPVQDVLAIHVDGTTAVVETRLTARLPDGSPYVNDYVFVFECSDGRVARVREYMDTARGHELIDNAVARPARAQAVGVTASAVAARGRRSQRRTVPRWRVDRRPVA